MSASGGTSARDRAARSAARRVACAVLLAIAACTPGSSTKAKDTGAVMTSEGVSLRRLGDVSPHVSYVGTDGRDFVDASPVVLWGGARPAAALYLSIESRGRKAVQRFAPIDASVRIPGFPVTNTVEAPEGATSMEEIDAIDTRAVLAADVDADGVQELVLLRKHGGVEVHSVRGPVAQFVSPGAGPKHAPYRRLLAHAWRVGARDVVYALAVCDDPGPDDRNLLLRVEGRSVTRVRLQGLERARILALGAIQRPGSTALDELLVVTEDGAQDAALARFAPDGRPLAPARRLYVRPSRECAFRFVPGSSHAVLEVRGGVLVLSPDKPVNWIREIKAADAAQEELSVLSVADLDGDPKLVHEAEGAVWAVNHDGTCFAPAGGGRWTVLAKPGPYLRVPVPPGETLWFVWQDDGGKLLAVSSRSEGVRPMTHEDWAKAADRWLPPAEAEAFRKRRTVSLDGAHPYRDMRMADEREDRKFTGEIRTLEDWKRLLPDSYAAVVKYNVTRHDVEVAARFKELRERPDRAAKVPDPAGLRAFLAELEVRPRTTFMVIDGTDVSVAEAPGAPPRLAETQLGGSVEYRVANGRLTAILALGGAGDAGTEPAFYQVEASLSPRR